MGETWDVIVVGGGPAGLSAALMLGRARRRVLVVDAGSPRNRFAAHMHGVLGNEGVPPSELLQRGRGEAAEYGVQFLGATVTRVAQEESGLLVEFAGAGAQKARAVVVASGVWDELPAIPGLAERWGRGVLHCPYCHGWEVRGQRLGVLVTSPTGVHGAQLIRQWSDRVTVFAADGLAPGIESRLRSRGIDIVPERVVEVTGDADRVTGVRTADGCVIPVDAIFTAGAPRPNDAFLVGLGLERSEAPFGLGSFLTVDPSGRTSNPRVWAVGNVANPAANVPMSIGAGASAGGAVNGALVEEDFDLALASEAAEA
ncbi:NAD(P)/FAD-dependent oxidoreductase [Sinomonas susongensis]|uniref:NAD(P)/FAD-dependent oxidoreductase n=1 Tax=Sinomonas susongensis TaxID=1324851 RepID=UPI001107CB1F|nr:NAD(P)/FAD-dependent oxidoreductase [Sinomonas susongensis]